MMDLWSLSSPFTLGEAANDDEPSDEVVLLDTTADADNGDTVFPELLPPSSLIRPWVRQEDALSR